MALLTLSTTSEFNTRFRNPNNDLRLRHWPKTILLEPSKFKFSFRIMGISDNRKLSPCQSSGHSSGVHLTSTETPRLHSALVQLAASAIFFVSFTARACTSASGKIPGGPSAAPLTVLEQTFGGSVNGDEHSGKLDSESHVIQKSEIVENIEDKELRAALESFKSKKYALTVPLRIVSLRGSVPPSWVKDFMQAQGKRLKLIFEFRGSIMDIFSDLSAAITKGTLKPKSALAADVVTVGDSWLSFAIKKDIIEPIQDVEIQDWFNELSEKWKIFLCRNCKGSLDSEGKIWAAPYRWGSMVIAYKKNKFKKHNLASIEDWGDLWRPELSGKISMVDSPREVVGAVLKYMGASYNTTDFDSQVLGGRNAVMQNLALFQKQVRLFDSVNYLKAFGVGDVWVAVGWSSDVLPAAKRMSNVVVVVPKSGASLWADLWAIPSATKFNTCKIGGRIRGPSPLINQWIEFCLQPARALPFKQEVIPGASPLSLEEDIPVKQSAEFTKGKPKLETNLIAGVPPPEILAKCEFLEPLSETALKDYQWLIAGMHKPGGLFNKIKHRILSFVQPR